MIPKIIHFCWLSEEKYPSLIQSCINSWKIYMPDFEIKLWTTKEIDINKNLWLKQTLENKKYAFASDYIRFYALYNYGGLYFDADVEVLKSFATLLEQNYILGEEAGGDIEAAVIGAEKGAEWVKKCLDYYENKPFIKENGSFDMKPAPLIVNAAISNLSFNIYPYYYFSPKDYNIGTINITSQTYCIHHFDGKWIKKGTTYKIKIFIHKTIYFIVGRKIHNKIVRFIRLFKK